jgi:3-phenylpropionate/cinnamic acid dioxygenase small subunit
LQVSEQTYSDIVKFLYKEAELQDLRRNREWLALWTEDSTYHMPIRVTKEKEVSGILERKQGGYIVDDRAFLELRVKREETDFAWAENPPSRSKHFISNIRVEPGEKEDEVKIKSYVLLTTHRGDDLNYDMLTYERLDVLRRVGNEWKIASRTVIPDQSRLTVDRISVFL